MKIGKIMITAFAAMAAASAARAGEIQVNFDGGKAAASFSQLAAQQAVPAPAATIPARSYAGAFVSGNAAAVDRTIRSAIDYARTNNRSAALVGGLECLLRNGSMEQKEAFVYGPGVFVLPDTCTARPAKPQLKCISSTVCSWITETIIRTSCNPNGECLDTTVDVLRKTCEDLCN